MSIKTISIDLDLNLDGMEGAIAKMAEEKVVEKVAADAEGLIFTHRNSWSTWRQPNNPSSRDGVNEPVIEVIKEFMNENKEEIIKRVSDNLTKRLAMSKGFKELKEGL